MRRENQSKIYGAFGMEMVGKNYSSNSYRYGFNGKEKDDEIKGASGTSYDYGFRIYDPRLGRFLSTDPLSKHFAWNSSYAFAENDVIRSVDLEGLEKFITNDGKYIGLIGGSTQVRTVDTKNIKTVAYWINQANNPPKNSGDQFSANATERAKQFSSLDIGKTLKRWGASLDGHADVANTGKSTPEGRRVAGGVVGAIVGVVTLGAPLIASEALGAFDIATAAGGGASFVNGLDDGASAFTKNNESFSVSLVDNPQDKTRIDNVKVALTAITFFIGGANAIKSPSDISNLIGTGNDAYSLYGSAKSEKGSSTPAATTTKKKTD